MDDKIGHAFAILSTPEFANLNEEAYKRLQSLRHLKWIVVPQQSAGLLEGYGTPAIVVRPDRYVHACARDGRDLLAVMEALPLELH